MNKYYEFLERHLIQLKESHDELNPVTLPLSYFRDSINDESLHEDCYLEMRQNPTNDICQELDLPELKVNVLLLSIDHFDRDQAENTTAYKISEDGNSIELFQPYYEQEPVKNPFDAEMKLGEIDTPIRIYDLEYFLNKIDVLLLSNHWATIALVDTKGECFI